MNSAPIRHMTACWAKLIEYFGEGNELSFLAVTVIDAVDELLM